MTITLTPEIEKGLKLRARELGKAPEVLALEKLRLEFGAADGRNLPFEPQDEWERRLLDIGKDCGISLSNEAVSTKGVYYDDYTDTGH